jgi:hypothetical protein
MVKRARSLATARVVSRPKGVAAGQGRSDDDKNCCHRNCNEPAHPIDSRTAIASKSAADKPSKRRRCRKNGEPHGSVSSTTRRDELAHESDDDSGNDHPNEFHHVSLPQSAGSSASYLQCARHHAPRPAMTSQTTPDPNRWLPCGPGAQKVQLRGSRKGFSVWSSSEKMPR